MPASLTLLDGVRFDGAEVVGDRSRALLAALAAGRGRAVRAERLVDLIWGEEPLANASKGLQVVVSRTRTACGPEAIVREGDGYRLGVDPARVDSSRLAALVADAGRAIADDPVAAAELARQALALANGLATIGDDERGPLADLRRDAVGDVDRARLLLAQASSRTGAHGDALPALEAAHAAHPDDESLLADLLRSEAVVRGPGAALERFERYRRDVRDRLGASPGEALQRVHRDLLALDRPVRSGVRYDATALLGRDQDVERLRALLSSARVVSILGPGGLGKTRLAHVLARDATEPAVHVVELVGVTAPEDLVGEVGSVLGVRDSVSSRRTLTPEQRADVRARVAQRLGQAPSLLILDNCEHLVAAVAELVAFLVSTTADLRVLTTTRAPLAIGAERVYQLGELQPTDAVELFRQRAVAARPAVKLDDQVVRRIVVRLDGLPLAIELAAAKVRVMAVEEIDRRLEDRFALLRGGDRSAPDRHRTLLAVIDWSWNLLGESERRALRRLALFHDGFTLDAAGEVLGDGAFDAVQNLVDQSLLSVHESAAGVRYRMLETVREFGRMQLRAVGEQDEARAAQRRWATGYAWRNGDRLAGADQFAAIDALAAEESNLADELRDAVADRDVEAAIQLLAVLGFFWSIRGNHGRLIALTEAIADVVRDWSPPEHLLDQTRAAMAVTLSNSMIASTDHTGPLRALLQRIGAEDGNRRLAATARVMLAYDPADAREFPARLEALARDPDRHVAQFALQWLSHTRENAGDPTAAVDAAAQALALARDEDGPWVAAILRTQLAQLTMPLGDREAATGYARAALPVLQRLGARDDEIQLRSLLALTAIAEGRPADAEAEIDLIDGIEDLETTFGGGIVTLIGRAELLLAQGDRAAGLRAYQDAAARMRQMPFPGVATTGLEPWTLFGEATALAAIAQHGGPEDDEAGRTLFRSCRGGTVLALNPDDPHLDYPVAGMLLFALGSWGLLRDAIAVDDAVTLLVLAERFAYNRMIPTMAWERIAPRAEERAPGRIDAARAALGERRAPELLVEARGLVERLGG
ncbi:Signal transduction response regulator [Patulibacter medicamentivorans]|uniref:Signal transduction response regulator n=1 Tax=Patulibacter medicamentivorans TaxID=1097667 RepID=H0EAS5_9ACTN|nr:BTAD domain-containing putative transcriptional regulator [Patulibacter medicamentivorans]EHN09250.1 Signal transduction response regulator [Patulibacter medicamentivorans]